MKSKLKIVKIGGNIIEDPQQLGAFLKDFAAIDGMKILVHGGGKSATEMANRLGLKPKMVEGRRVTDIENLDIAVMVYAGLINKNIVTKLQVNSCNAIGFTGADANLILSGKRPVKYVDYGFVGDIVNVNRKTIKLFLDNKMTPVFCAITHDKSGQLLNTNADTIASEIAIAMSDFFEVELNYIFELKGVLENIENKASVISHINTKKYEQLIDDGIISKGMLPKLHNCFRALEKGVQEVKIGDVSLIADANNLHTTLSLK
ncbi:MAG: acetylglutamate kinase [Flavobacteriales bacterium]|jgi:acetylglutamate kinase|nr:acetylglutamate kinase [Flavobacteriales bacterium]